MLARARPLCDAVQNDTQRLTDDSGQLVGDAIGVQGHLCIEFAFRETEHEASGGERLWNVSQFAEQCHVKSLPRALRLCD